MGLVPDVLRDRDFRSLYLARSISILGNRIAPIALAFAVLEIGDAGDLGFVIGAATVPSVLFILFGGVLAHRLSPPRMMFIADVVDTWSRGSPPHSSSPGTRNCGTWRSCNSCGEHRPRSFAYGGTLWDTTMQEQIPRNMLARVSAYDWLGSTLLLPVGTIAAGTLGVSIGFGPTLIGGAVLLVVSTAAVMLVKDVRELRRPTAPVKEEL